MSKVETMLMTAKAKVQSWTRTMASKMDGDSQLVVALVLIAVAIGLCIIFRNQINKVMVNLLNQITKSINDMSAGAVVVTNPTN